MKSSKKIALCGIIASLSVVCMFLTGIIPVATFSIPAFCGVLLLVIYIEMGMKQSLLVYLAVCILSLALSPDREAAALYILFFGYYPMVKDKLENKFSKVLALIIKLCILFASGGIFVLCSLFLFGLQEVSWSIWLIVGGCVSVVVVFFIYDLAVKLVGQMYLEKIRRVYLKKFFDDK